MVFGLSRREKFYGAIRRSHYNFPKVGTNNGLDFVLRLTKHSGVKSKKELIDEISLLILRNERLDHPDKEFINDLKKLLSFTRKIMPNDFPASL